jgi:transposase-like protein
VTLLSSGTDSLGDPRFTKREKSKKTSSSYRVTLLREATRAAKVIVVNHKYLNNIVEQDHRAVKRITDPVLGFKSFWSAQKLIAGIETMRMVKKGQLDCPNGQPMSAADQFYSLAV